MSKLSGIEKQIMAIKAYFWQNYSCRKKFENVTNIKAKNENIDSNLALRLALRSKHIRLLRLNCL